MENRYRNHDAETLCGQLRTDGLRNKCYGVATLKAVAPANGHSELFCNRHATYVRKGQGASIFASLVRHGVAVLTEVR